MNKPLIDAFLKKQKQKQKKMVLKKKARKPKPIKSNKQINLKS